MNKPIFVWFYFMYHFILVSFSKWTILFIEIHKITNLYFYITAKPLDWSISFWTWGINQYSNHELDIFLFYSRVFWKSPVACIEAIGTRLLFWPGLNQLGVIKSMLSKSLTIFPNASDKSFIAIEASATTVYLFRIDSFWLHTDFSTNDFSHGESFVQLCH